MKNKADLLITAPTLITCAPGTALKRGKAMQEIGLIKDGAVAILGEKIAAVGTSQEVLAQWYAHPDSRLEYPESTIIPGLVDPHTHPIFAGSRISEFELRAKGATYTEIAAAGGGIAYTVQQTRAASDLELEELTKFNLMNLLLQGSTTVEAKSGYGLSKAEELRQLKILNRLKAELPLDLVITFMGAHSIPMEYKEKRDAYVKLVIQMLPQVKEYAEFVDVFCETGAFTVEESREILKAAKAQGFGLKIHAEEFTPLGGALMAAELGAVSLEHLLTLPQEQIKTVAQSPSIPVLLPCTSFFLNESFAPARQFIEAGAGIALGTDFNAGSNMSASQAMSIALAVLRMKLTPAEALNAVTVNAACALKKEYLVGSLESGKQADMLVLDLPDYREMAYRFGENHIQGIIKKGKLLYERINLL
jgi:imidazolonepropionase